MARSRKKKRIPESRVYVHLECGKKTGIDGAHFKAISHPFSPVVTTYCTRCDEQCPLDEFEWEDTGELISDTRARWAEQAPSWVRLLCSRTGCLGSLALALIAGAVVGGVLGLLTGKVVLGVLGAVVGGLAGAAVVAIVLALVVEPAVFRNVYGVDDVRLLE